MSRRLTTELQNFPDDSMVSASPIDGDLFHWQGVILGPLNTPYEGGVFLIDIQIPASYPFERPKVQFATRIFHCSIQSDGKLCSARLYKEWSPTLTLYNVLKALETLLKNPDAIDPLNNEAAVLFVSNRSQYDLKAKEYTESFAM